jgi:hypothetical protein
MWNLLLPALAIGGGLFLANRANTQAANTVNAAVQQQQTLDNQIAQSGGVGPGSQYLRSLVVQPNTLTPAQQSQLADLRRSVANQIHGSQFAGGRTAAALFKQTEDNYVNDALQQNRQQSINAADQLAGTSNKAAEAGAAAGVTGATTVANSDLATGKLYGQALGDVSSLINRQNKAETTGNGGNWSASSTNTTNWPYSLSNLT